MDGPTLVLIAIMGNRVFFNLRSEDIKSRETTRTHEQPSALADSETTVQFASSPDPEVGDDGL